ncbi:MAG: SDR family oxidoreductase [Bacteroidales bacterium]|nr:SDR family oxidoreductase [Bacteroidales bacterium]
MDYSNLISKQNILVTGGAGFIGSNLSAALLGAGNKVTVLDNFATGHKHNIEAFHPNPDFTLIEGDIRDLDVCHQAVAGKDYVFHQAALGSVPRSVKDPITSNDVNVNGSLNMMVAARDAGVKRFVFASSSSVFGDAPELPKIESKTGNPLSPYAITKAVNELYADVFAKTYGIEIIGLRYFNVFGPKQDPDGAYAAVIPKWVKQLINHESPLINGDGSFSRDFTYIENVIQANIRAAITPTERIIEGQKKYYGEDYNEQVSICEFFNVAFGGNTNLLELLSALKDNLSKFDPKIAAIEAEFGPFRAGDIPHSQASILKAQTLLGYDPKYDARQGFENACEWYYQNLS